MGFGVLHSRLPYNRHKERFQQMVHTAGTHAPADDIAVRRVAQVHEGRLAGSFEHDGQKRVGVASRPHV